MESSVVLFNPRIHLFACTHPSVSNSLDCNDWLAYKHQSTSLCPNTWFFAVYKHQFPLCVSNMFGLWLLVCVHAPVSSLSVKHAWMVIPGSSTSISLLPVFPTRLFKHGWSMVLCLCTHIRFQSCVQTRFVCGCSHLSSALYFKHVCLLLLF